MFVCACLTGALKRLCPAGPSAATTSSGSVVVPSVLAHVGPWAASDGNADDW